jgi:hypothetical protein
MHGAVSPMVVSWPATLAWPDSARLNARMNFPSRVYRASVDAALAAGQKV